MDQTIVARIDRSDHEGAVAGWAAHEARLRGLPLLTVDHLRPDILSKAKMVALGMPGEGGTAGPAQESAALAVVGASSCPVVLVPDAPGLGALPHSRHEVVLGVDARDPAAAAIDFAFETALTTHVRLHAVHAWSLPSCAAELPFGIPEEDRGAWEDHEVQLLADVLRPWLAKYPGVRVLEDIVLFAPELALIRKSASAALVVVGRRAGSGSAGITQALLRDAECPVAVVPW